MLAVPAFASGFQIFEHSAKASAQAGAWAARADDAAANWYNPAAMVWNDGLQLQFGLNYITIGSDTTFTAGTPTLQNPNFGAPAGASFKAKQTDATPIHLYFTQKVNDRIAWGIGVNNPFGLITEWQDRPITFSSKRADLETWVANGNVAFRVAENFSLALGVDYMKAKIKDFSREIPWGSVNPAFNGLYGGTNLTGDGDAWGWNLAASYKKSSWALGLTYRAALKPKIDGNVEFSSVPAPIAALFPNGPATAKINLPAMASIGAACTSVKNWQFEFDIDWTQWSSFDSLNVDIQNNTLALADIAQRENWKATWSYRFGASYTIKEKHQIRFGALYDTNPIPDDTIRPSIPDGDRYAPTLGYGYMAKKFDVDFYWMPLMFKDRTATGSNAEGVINGSYKTTVQLFGASFNFKF